MKRRIIIVSIALFLTGCFDNSEAKTINQDSIKLGKSTFEENCMSCHGKNAAGITKNWQKKLANGKYPAPPLNGTAHAWHHSPKQLLMTINNGGKKLGGWMPGFKDKLTSDEKQGLLDFMYSLWPNNIKKIYDEKFK